MLHFCMVGQSAHLDEIRFIPTTFAEMRLLCSVSGDGCAGGECGVFVQSVTMLSAPGHGSPRWGPLVHMPPLTAPGHPRY